MKQYIKKFIPAAALVLSMGMTSCINDLDVEPIDPNLDTEVSAEACSTSATPIWPGR